MNERQRGWQIKELFKLLNSAVNIAVLAFVVALVGIAIYALSDTASVVIEGAPEQYAIYKPGEDKQSFEELIEINPEVIGWINIYGTKIDYPITQAKDNDKYLMLGPDLKYSLLGSIFLDAGNEPDFSDFCNVLYGHNMTPRAMFGNIKDFREKAYFDAHMYGDLYYDDTHHGLEIFAVFQEDGYSHFLRQLKLTAPEDKEAYLQAIYEKSLFVRDIGVTADDRIVMMYTCSNAETNGRDLLVARITDETFANDFEEVVVRNDGWRATVKKVPLWLWPFLLLLLLLLIWALIRWREHRMRKKEAAYLAAETETTVKAEASEDAGATATAPDEKTKT